MLNRYKKTRRNPLGITLIELLVVALVLVILMAVDLPCRPGNRAGSQKKTERANVKTHARAEPKKRFAQ